ncbi:PRC-barrel domain-containing protein [Methylocystis echinoides]|jgi:sporulation protein YlmC with PRC-barrel domain|uniref:PRC-barrel domain-containing protein n=1 Tax=Methylocystis echinoides TaxID=29468 RepID=UPI00342C7A06
MIKAIMFAATLATAGAGVVYAQQSGTTGGSPGSTMGTGAERGTGTMGTERGTGGTMGRSGTMGAREGAQTGATAQMMTTLPQHATAVSNWYDQNVYDPNDNKIGEVKDMLLDREGKVQAVIVSVGGFLGMGEKDVAVPFDAVSTTQRENRWWLSMNASKDQLRTAPGFRFDRSKQAWTVAVR